MPRMIKDLNTRAELELFLVSKCAKPAALVTIDASVAWIDEDIVSRQHNGHNSFSALTQSLVFSEKELRTFELYLLLLDMHYQRRNRGAYTVLGAHGNTHTVDTVGYYIAKRRDSLSALIHAFDTNDDYSIGRALGYPEEACRAYGTVIRAEKRDATYTAVQLARAKKAGISIPSWMSYVTWIPEKIDFVADRISVSTKNLATEYQLLTSEFNRELAHRLETNFKNENLPVRWRLQIDGCYNVQYPTV